MEEVVQTLAEEGVLDGERGNYRLEQRANRLAHLSHRARGTRGADRPPAPEEKALLQQLAVIGREFPLSLVRQVVPQPEEELYRLLASLQQQRVSLRTAGVPRSGVHLQARPDPGGGLQHGAAGATKALHERTAKRSKRCTAPRLRSTTASWRITTAAVATPRKPWSTSTWRATGGATLGQCGSDHSSDHRLRAAQHLPDTRERAQQELTLHLALGVAVTGHQRGFLAGSESYLYPGPGAVPAGGGTPALSGLCGAAAFHLARGRTRKRRKTGRAMLRLGPEGRTNPALLLEAHLALGELVLSGRIAARPQSIWSKGLRSMISSNTATAGLSFEDTIWRSLACAMAAWSLWRLGYPDQALKKNARHACTRPRRSSHPLTLGFALAFAAYVYSSCGERHDPRERAEVGITLCDRARVSRIGSARNFSGLGTRCNKASRKKGLHRYDKVWPLPQTTWVQNWTDPYYLALLAETYGKLDEPERAAQLAEALAGQKNRRAFYEAELYRLKRRADAPKSKVQASKV